MSINPEIKTKLRALKGAPLTVLFTILLSGGLLQRKQDLYWLYNDRTVSGAIDALSDAGLIAKTSAGWMLTAGGQQIALYLQSDPQLRDPQFRNPQIGELSDPELVESTISGENIVESTSFSLRTTTIINDLKDLSSSSSTPKNRRKYDFPQNDPPPDPETIQALAEAGIHEPSRSELARLAHVTPDYLRALIQDWRLDPDPRRRKVPLLIHRIRSGDQPTIRLEITDYAAKYCSGEHADLIES